MSGFVALVNLDGSPIDPSIMRRLTDALAFRGPDGRNIWTEEQVGLGHALFQTTDAATLQRQPCSLDGRLWIAGDIRVDRRGELVRGLEQGGCAPPTNASDAELVLHAYRAWGERLLDHVIGDFSFALWDRPNKRLFCARDHFGVKPFFYAHTRHDLILSNTLSCLRAHDAVSDALNDVAVGSFLVNGFNADPATTTFSAIQRLPGGHSMTWIPGQDPVVRRYWTLPVTDELTLKRPEDYAERFRALLEEATRDRLRTDRVAVHMSGGMDSSLIAATASHLLASIGKPFEVRAHTVVYDRLFVDEERHHSDVVARHLKLPIDYLVADDFELSLEADGPKGSFPEPLDGHAQSGLINAFNHQVAATNRVALTGFDGDALLTASWQKQLARSASARNFRRFVGDSFSYAQAKLDLRGALRRRLTVRNGGPRDVPSSPTWLAPALKRQMQEDEMARGIASSAAGTGPRAGAHAAMTHQNWISTLESLDAGVTGVPIDRRHPLLDLRVVEFGLSLPAIPWCVDKHVLRCAGRDMLPPAIVDRPKSALAEDPMPYAIRNYASHAAPLVPHPDLGRFIERDRLGTMIDDLGSPVYWFTLRGLILNKWLARR